MKKAQEIRKHIDRAVGTEGTLRIPSWWMRKILTDIVKFCEEKADNDALDYFKSYVNEQLTILCNQDVSLLDKLDNTNSRVSALESKQLFVILNSLPEKGVENKIYLIPNLNGEDKNVLTEWAWINETWEQFGEFKPEIDLTPYMVNITYNELVTLRDNAQLIPGQQYRITDYVTNTIQENTQSAGHQFDIIVTADDENTLNEVARACKTEFDLEKYKDAFSPSWTEHMSYVGIYEYEGKEYHLYESEAQDLQMLMDFNSQNILEGIYLNEAYPYSLYPAYCRQKEESWGGWNIGHDFAENIAFKYNLAEDTYFFSSNLVAWQIWYCLDNDTSRFAWAKTPLYSPITKQKMIIVNDGGATYIYVRDSSYDSDGKCAWLWESQYSDIYFLEYVLSGSESLDSNDIIYTDSEELEVGAELDMGGTPVMLADMSWTEGNGVIYHMIDEWNNDCPYDFKNIQFNRGVYDGGGIAPNGDEDMNFYLFTFSFRTDDNEIIDTSIFGNNGRLLNDEGQISGVYGNVIGQYVGYDGSIENPTKPPQRLNDIVFYSHYDFEGETYYGCYSNSFGNNCYSNSFGNECQANRFGANCFSNRFGDYTQYNIFGDQCYSNIFGNNCYSNSFGSACNLNIFGDGFYANSFGNNCNYNVFGGSCEHNSFGNGCHSNSFGYHCNHNSFGNNCGQNSFGHHCRCNSFGNGCYYNSFRLSASKASSLKDFCYLNHFDDGCSYNVIWNSDITTNANVLLKNINVNRGVSGTDSNYNFINIDTLNSEKEININNYNGHIYTDYGDIFKVTYSELWLLRENAQLIPGRQYRITDYNTTTSQENTRSAEHKFDIIVTAIDEYRLSEEAQAIRNIDDDDYFDNSNLSAWKIWYSLDNDAGHFVWARNERIETDIVEGIDSSNCTISVGYSYDDEEGLNKFDNRVSFISQVWNDPSDEAYLEGSAIDELITHWGYETDPNGIENCLTLYGLNLEIDEETGEIISEDGISLDRWFYRGIITVDNTDYDYWEKAEKDNGEFCYMDQSQQSSEKLFFLTDLIVSGEPIITTTTVKTVIPLEPKGVIYRMIDEWGNDCPYDFKNIMFKRYELEAPDPIEDKPYIAQLSTNIINQFNKGILSYIWSGLSNNTKYWEEDYSILNSSLTGNTKFFYTFSNVIDDIVSDKSLTDKCYSNTIKKCGINQYTLNNIVFFNTNIGSSCDSNSFGDNCRLNSFGNNCHHNSFGNYCDVNILGNDYHNNSFGNYWYLNSFGNNCYNNTFGDYCESNSFGDNCYNNSFGHDCSRNSFGNDCINNSFGIDCDSNSLGNDCCTNLFDIGCYNNNFDYDCSNNSFGSYCHNNSFGHGCYDNTFGNNCRVNLFGDDCHLNTFGNGCESNSFRASGDDTSSLKSYCYYNHFDDGCSYNVIWNAATTSSSYKLQNININRGTSGTYSSHNMINIDVLNQDYKIQVAKNSKGEIKIYCEADLIA